MVYGAVSGFFGGWVDALMMRIVDILLSIPQLFLLIVLAVIFHPSLCLLIFVIAFVAWLVPGRLIRGETLTLRVREYVQAVRVMGGSRSRIVFRHIIPNTVGTIVVNATFQVADAILLLAAPGLPRPRAARPPDRLGLDAHQRVSYAINGYWWQIYPGRVLHRARGGGLQLRRRRPARRSRGPAATSLSARPLGRAGRPADDRSADGGRHPVGGSAARSASAAGSGRPRGGRVPKGRSGGSSWAQISWAKGQRVRNRHPDGGLMAEGSSPSDVAPGLARARATSGSGMASIRARV